MSGKPKTVKAKAKVGFVSVKVLKIEEEEEEVCLLIEDDDDEEEEEEERNVPKKSSRETKTSPKNASVSSKPRKIRSTSPPPPLKAKSNSRAKAKAKECRTNNKRKREVEAVDEEGGEEIYELGTPSPPEEEEEGEGDKEGEKEESLANDVTAAVSPRSKMIIDNKRRDPMEKFRYSRKNQKEEEEDESTRALRAFIVSKYTKERKPLEGTVQLGEAIEYNGVLSADGLPHGPGYTVDGVSGAVKRGGWVEGSLEGWGQEWACWENLEEEERRETPYHMTFQASEKKLVLRYEGEFADSRYDGVGYRCAVGTDAEDRFVVHHCIGLWEKGERGPWFCDMVRIQAQFEWQSSLCFFMNLDLARCDKRNDSKSFTVSLQQQHPQLEARQSKGSKRRRRGGREEEEEEKEGKTAMLPNMIVFCKNRSMMLGKMEALGGRMIEGIICDMFDTKAPYVKGQEGSCEVLDTKGRTKCPVKNQLVLDASCRVSFGNKLVPEGMIWRYRHYEGGSVISESVKWPKTIPPLIDNNNNNNNNNNVEAGGEGKQQQQQQKQQQKPRKSWPKPVYTFFQGWKFASLLEARWAVFLESLGWTYYYEPYRLVREDFTYTVDFLVLGHETAQENYVTHGAVDLRSPLKASSNPPVGSKLGQRKDASDLLPAVCSEFSPFWIEVKPVEPSHEERLKMSALVEETNIDGYIFYGSIFAEAFDKKFVEAVRGIHFRPSKPRSPRQPVCFAECPHCQRVEITYYGSEVVMSCGCDKEQINVSKYFSRVMQAFDNANNAKIVRPDPNVLFPNVLDREAKS